MDVGLVCDACSALTPIGVPQCKRCGAEVALDPRPRLKAKPQPQPPPAAIESSGVSCSKCGTAVKPGTRFCPHDAEELIAAQLWEATHGKRHDPVPTGIFAKICPQCATRYDLATTFCGRDGAELMTIN